MDYFSMLLIISLFQLNRHYKHRNYLQGLYEDKKNATELRKHIWDLRDRNITDDDIEWPIIDRAPSFKNGSRKCELSLAEKFQIIRQKLPFMNKRNELVSKYHHVNKFHIRNFKETPPNNAMNRTIRWNP